MKELLAHISASLKLNISRVSNVRGGDINAAYCLHTDAARCFLKVNSKSRFPGMFAAEAKGLRMIQATGAVAVPNVILQGEVNDNSYLVLEWLDTQRPDASASRTLGRQLAAMHRHTAPAFGLDHDNYMGSLPQSNSRHNNWTEFFVNERLQPMVSMAYDKGEISKGDVWLFDVLYKKLPDLFSHEVPALVHGDLWGGNYLVSSQGVPYLIDPAISYGHREFDIAMTTLFGGFHDSFYDAYNEAFPLTQGWQQRLGLYNLYPLLVHVNLFGGGYRHQTMDVLRHFV